MGQKIVTFMLKAATLLVFLAVTMSATAQLSIYDVQNLLITESSIDSSVSYKFVGDNYLGQAELRNRIKSNPDSFPLEAEAKASSRDFEHEVHKRWERYMRKLPVKIVDVANFHKIIKVKASIKKGLETDFTTDTLVLIFKNKKKYSIATELEISSPSKVVLPRYNSDVIFTCNKNDSDSHFKIYTRGKAILNLKGKGALDVRIPILYSNDGISEQKHFSASLDDFTLDFLLTGYLYNEEEKTLYKITSLNNTL